MWQTAQNAYLESRIESADPIELVRLLYQGAITAVREARSHLAEREIAARSQSISKAQNILVELATSLDHQRGGDLSRRLAQLYDYLIHRLAEANFRQTDEPLAEVLGLLTALAGAWDGIQAQAAPVENRESPWAQPVQHELASAYL